VHNPIAEMAALAVDVAIDRPSVHSGETSDQVLAPGFTVRATTGPAPS
jgi:DNA-binding LacI/PurR family transcriptional regulator